MKTSDSIIKVSQALFKVQTEMDKVIKDSKNPFFKSNYADINALNDQLKPLITAAGLLVMQPPTNVEGKNYIETIIIHAESGEFVSSLNEVIVSKQNDPQSYLAAQTYTRRGALQATFNMGAVDDDGNFASGKSDKLENTKTPAAPAKPASVVDQMKQATASKVEAAPTKGATTKFAPKAKPTVTKTATNDIEL